MVAPRPALLLRIYLAYGCGNSPRTPPPPPHVLRGLETVLQDELMAPAIGATMVKSSGRGCHFRGDQAVGYKAILWLRTAHRY